MTKPKEFWIYGLDAIDGHSLVQAYESPKDDIRHYSIRVIEKSAYDKAIDALRDIADNKHFQTDREYALHSVAVGPIVKWTEESAKHLFLKGWNNRAYVAEQTLKELGELDD